MKIFPLSEGSFTIDATKEFIPFNKQNQKLEERSKGSLLVEIQPFVLITENDIILLDTGLGKEINGGLQIHKNLMEIGINPSEITKVLLTHLHKDHAGAITQSGKPAYSMFPNATYFIHEKELEFACSKNSMSYNVQQLQDLKATTKICLLKDEEGLIDQYINYKLTRAHSKFHQVFWIREAEQIIFFGGDDAPQLQQMKHRFVAKYDFDGRKSMLLRKEWWERGLAEKWTFLFYHDIQNPVVKG